MATKRFTKEDIHQTAAFLKEGKVVAFPTDTVFGLGVIYENSEALDALKRSKGRPENKPIPTMVASIEQMKAIAVMDDATCRLAAAFMPGAFTMILKKKECVPDYATNGFPTIGIRMPDDAFVLKLIEECGKPLLVTSANRSGEETGVCDEQVLKQLDGRIDAIVMGEAKGKQASTIVDMSNGTVHIVREGPIMRDEIDKVLQQK